MREIKFRAYTGEGMIGWDKLSSDHYGLEEFTNGWAWQQYTGLKDKNGKEIYEGDILRIPNWSGGQKCKRCGFNPRTDGIAKVIWANESWRCGDRCSSLAQFRFEIDIEDYELDDVEDYEVIGNIYENPGLLEVKQ